MVNQSLKNKRIIISAGASGIGLATSKGMPYIEVRLCVSL